ncbi:YlaF family protein [Bacillus massilinigeriensis]|uniref:YlaF family protein n=1 Tax=Bacillus mediterraneensis TaxID=1805474 RepID=UPI0008F8BCA1|nr:YlaF family protein [Bacillus mediterraneensis]
MKNIQWIFLGFAILSAVCMMGIGISIAEDSLTGVILSIIGLIAVMGYGFKTKKKRRESGKL